MTVARALVLSPSASHPRDYGNRNRVWQTTRFLQAQGFEIHFVLYPIEDDWQNGMPNSADEMRAAWTSFTVIPPSVKLHSRAAGDYHTIDEWWDPQIEHYLRWLLARQPFNLMVVNYAFLSKAFELAPDTVVKVLETHDLFTGRKEMLAALGLEPEFFYTVPDQERIAFDRADLIVAIKDSEAKLIAGQTRRDVVALPFFPDFGTLKTANGAAREPASEILRVGFIGADNQVNVANVQRFLDLYERYEMVYSPPMEIVIAGGVCGKLTAGGSTVKLVGRVPDIREFYDGIDVALVPLSLSTGIKIKTGEALGQGIPIVSTGNGFDGYPAVDEYHNLPTLRGVCEALVRLAFDRSRLDLLAERTRMAAKLAERRTASAYLRLAAELRRQSVRIAIVTDRDVVRRPTVAHERLGQWIELCSHIAPTVLIIIGERPPDWAEMLRPLRASEVEFIEPASNVAAEVEKILVDSNEILPIGEVVLSLEGDSGRPLLDRLKPRFPALSIDLWTGTLALDLGLSAEQAGEVDIWALVPATPAATERQIGLRVVPLRYVPGHLYSWNRGKIGDEIIVVLCDPSDQDLVALGILTHRFRKLRRVGVFGDSEREIGLDGVAVLPEAALFSYLVGADKPSRVVAIGSDRRKARLYREFARHTEIGFGRIACADLPYWSSQHDRQPTLCLSPNDAVTCACASLDDLSVSEMSDSQWAPYWDLTVAKLGRFKPLHQTR
jgi:hypothetical protein